jgi:hypothetical protein
MYAEDDEDLVERVSDDEPQDDDAMVEDDGNADNRGSGQQARSRSGRDVPDDEPPLEGYERFVVVGPVLSILVRTVQCLQFLDCCYCVCGPTERP